jgi:hypothetical protein
MPNIMTMDRYDIEVFLDVLVSDLPPRKLSDLTPLFDPKDVLVSRHFGFGSKLP